MMNPSILIVDDDAGTRFGFSAFLSKVGFEVHEAASLKDAKKSIIAQRVDSVLLDLHLPDGNGIDWIIDLRDTFPDIAIVVITGAGDISVAVDAMQRGADNFLTKPVNMPELEVFLRKSMEIGALRRKNLTYDRLQKKTDIYFGESSVMQANLELAAMAASNRSPVLLIGETGTGKGVLARWIHENSPQGSEAFVEVNCSSLRGEMLASELFGHAKGAFTSAVQDRQGLIEVANAGTLFLDEIGDMDQGVQTQFLKVIEEKTFRRLGEVKIRRSDFRLICATNHDLVSEARDGLFRSDLYYRINVFPIVLPPLRDRKEDIIGLVTSFMNHPGTPEQEISPEIMRMLKSYSWQGNIRELKNVMERASILSKGKPLALEHFPGLTTSDIQPPKEWPVQKLDSMEESHISHVIEQCGGDTRKAAQELGISRATLYRKLKKFKESK